MDIILTNDPLLISNVFINEPFSTSDHASITFVINIMISAGHVDNCSDLSSGSVHADKHSCVPAVQHFSVKSYDWSKADWASLNNCFVSYG